MTDPRLAFETDNGRYYRIPGVDKDLISVTNAISVALAKFGLPLWYANMATEAAWELLPAMGRSLRVKPCGRKDLYASDPEERACGECPDCLTTRIKKAAEEKRDSASVLGTRVHELAEAHVLGRELPYLEGDHEAGWYVRQYLKFLKDFDVNLETDVVSAESTVCDVDLGYAGTGDVWLKLPFDGFLWEGTTLKTKPVKDRKDRGTILIDIKTSRKRAVTQTYPENILQLAALSHAKSLVLPDDSLVPNIRVHGAATLQLRENSYALIPMPARVNEFDLFKRVLRIADWLHHEYPGGYDYRPLNPNGTIKPKRSNGKKAS